jgi:hypothetical protein
MTPQNTLQRTVSTTSQVKLFDSGEGYGAIKNLATLTDPTLAKRDGRWHLFLAGMDRTTRTINLFEATLPAGAGLGDPNWSITVDPANPTAAKPLVVPNGGDAWDGTGLHCPAFVRGTNAAGFACERIYYAGSNNKTYQGPYAIGCLEWKNGKWERVEGGPVFAATEPWEGGSVFEPSVVFSDGKWRLWYGFGPSKSWRFGIGYAESEDGLHHWSQHRIYLPDATNTFDCSVIEAGGRLEGVLARNPWAGPPTDGNLLWSSIDHTASDAAGSGSQNVVLLGSKGTEPWHGSGAWKPAFQYDETDPTIMYVFFDGSYPSGLTPPQRPFHLTLGRLTVHWNADRRK